MFKQFSKQNCKRFIIIFTTFLVSPNHQRDVFIPRHNWGKTRHSTFLNWVTLIYWLDGRRDIFHQNIHRNTHTHGRRQLISHSLLSHHRRTEKFSCPVYVFRHFPLTLSTDWVFFVAFFRALFSLSLSLSLFINSCVVLWQASRIKRQSDCGEN